MGDIAIRAEGLSKQYHIGGQQTPDKLSDQLADMFVAPFRRAGKLLRGQAGGAAELDDAIWALKDVSFEIKPGEVVGIIGRNGAGKSTLLKILSRISEPTEGYAEIHGRVGSLLEVGTGFHPELTGRENVYLNGAILGMKKVEIEHKFDEIVAFAEIDKFIDTPVKHYSSGMYVRLAFSVAAYLEPEILLVDEVLAVGDLAFQKKCLGKMENVANQGRTVLFVSHNMGMVQRLCQHGMFINLGRVAIKGNVNEAIGAYLRTLEGAASQKLSERRDRQGKGKIRLTGVEISDASDQPSTTLTTGRPARFVFHLSDIPPGMPDVNLFFVVYDQNGQPITWFNSAVLGPQDTRDPSLKASAICDIDELLLVPGRYRINVGVRADGGQQDHIDAAALFDVVEGQVGGRPVIKEQWPGSVCFHSRWTLPDPE
jgi:lipopolysaccharide transport system ATP-binding protein